MRLKIDENLPLEAAEMLRAAGHDAATVFGERLSGSSDAQVAERAQRESRAVETLDLDFGDIRRFPPGEHSGILVLRPKTQAKPAVLALLRRVLPLLDTEPLDGRLWIVEEDRVRIR